MYFEVFCSVVDGKTALFVSCFTLSQLYSTWQYMLTLTSVLDGMNVTYILITRQPVLSLTERKLATRNGR